MLCSLATALAAPHPAAADEVEAKRAEAQRLAAELDQLGQRLSQRAEDYNESRLRVASLEQEARRLGARTRRTEAAHGLAVARVKEIAVEAYVRGGLPRGFDSVVESATVNETIVRTSYLQALRAEERDAVDRLHSTARELGEDRAALTAARSSARQALDEATAAKNAAAAAEQAQRDALARARGELAQLVDEERRRQAAKAARQARLAAERRARAEAEAEAAERAQLAAERQARDARRAQQEESDRTAPPPASPTTSTTARPAPPPPQSGPAGDGPPRFDGAAIAVEEARRQIGKPYRWGGSGPDEFDCSGLTAWAWRAAGVYLPHSSRAQYGATSRVAFSEIRPGDLLFFGNPIHHVAIYVGDGQMIEASQTGVPVRYASVYRRDFTGAGRVG